MIEKSKNVIGFSGKDLIKRIYINKKMHMRDGVTKISNYITSESNKILIVCASSVQWIQLDQPQPGKA